MRSLVLRVVGKAEIANRVRVAFDAAHQDVVILRGVDVGAARARLARNRLGEVVKGARVGAGDVEADGLDQGSQSAHRSKR